MPTALTGAVARTVGMTVSVAGFPAPVGAVAEIQRQAGAHRAGGRRAGKSRHPPALDHLRVVGSDQEGHDRNAGTGLQGSLQGPRHRP